MLKMVSWGEWVIEVNESHTFLHDHICGAPRLRLSYFDGTTHETSASVESLLEFIVRGLPPSRPVLTKWMSYG